MVLRLYSAFFRTFLDSSDKDAAIVHEDAHFRYDYVSVLDPDGGWGIEVAKKVCYSWSAKISNS